jgi:methanesulfonate monooxygenase large subunit
MPAKNHKQWKIPAFEEGDYVDSRIYSDQEIFDEEMEKIFKQVWIPVCHESEVPEAYDFRTTSIAKEPIIVVRGPDNEVRAFFKCLSSPRNET